MENKEEKEQTEKKKYTNKKRQSGEYLQLHMQLPKKLSEELDEYAACECMTKAAYITNILQIVAKSNGKLEQQENADVLSRIDQLSNQVRELEVKLESMLNVMISLMKTK